MTKPENSSIQPKRPGKRFVKGVSGNPGGRPRLVGDVRDAAREHTAAAIQRLAEIMQDKKSPAVAAVTAAMALLDRGWGKPSQTIEGNLTLRTEIATKLEAARARIRDR